MYYVTERWPGGLLTNFATINKSINRLKEIEQMKQDGTFQKLTKKEVANLETELGKLKKNFSGIIQMEHMPGAIFIVDTKKEETASREAKRLSIPIIGLIDTNSDPGTVNYPIPGNDDATKSIHLISSLIADTVIEGRKKFLSYLSESGVAIEKKEEQMPKILPEEEVKIKEIEEIVETTQAPTEEAKPVRKGHTRETRRKKE